MASATRTVSNQGGSDVTESVQGKRVVTSSQPESKSTVTQAAAVSETVTQEDRGFQVSFTLKLDVGVGTERFT
ncbi:MAG TPA: hypothetical protein VD994_20340 [Prosthecobacter sp.]|nr:hypothetical protein [Prosthecobacter sp.]